MEVSTRHSFGTALLSRPAGSIRPIWFLPVLLVLVCLSVPTMAKTLGNTSGEDDGWRLTKERNGIRVFMRHTENSRLKTFRGVKRIQVRNPYSIAAPLNDYPSMKNWLHLVHKAEEISRSDHFHRNIRISTELPWPIRDREAILKADAWQDPVSHDLKIRFSNAPYLLPPNDHYIRFPAFEGKLDFDWLGITPTGLHEFEVTYEIIFDIGGNIPIWVVNAILNDTPYYTLMKLDRIIRVEPFLSYQDHALYYPESTYLASEPSE